MQSKQIGKHLNRKYSKRHKLFHGFILSKVIETQHPNSTISVHTSEYLIFFRIWLHFHHQALVMELQSFKKVNYVHSINQMRLFWLLNVECFSIIFLKYISFHFTFSNQNKRIWLTECTYFTYLKIAALYHMPGDENATKCEKNVKYSFLFLKLLNDLHLISALLIITQTSAR